MYKGGTRYIDSVRVNMTYSEVAFRWSEKVNSDLLELKYKLPEDDLDPDNLITVRDDTDLQVRTSRRESWSLRPVMCQIMLGELCFCLPQLLHTALKAPFAAQ